MARQFTQLSATFLWHGKGAHLRKCREKVPDIITKNGHTPPSAISLFFEITVGCNFQPVAPRPQAHLAVDMTGKWRRCWEQTRPRRRMIRQVCHWRMDLATFLRTSQEANNGTMVDTSLEHPLKLPEFVAPLVYMVKWATKKTNLCHSTDWLIGILYSILRRAYYEPCREMGSIIPFTTKTRSFFVSQIGWHHAYIVFIPFPFFMCSSLAVIMLSSSRRPSCVSA